MLVTEQFIKQKFDTFNQHYFGGELIRPEIRINHSKRLLGVFYYNYTIEISDYFDRTEHDYCMTLLHEMVHLYIHQNNLKDTSSHGKLFKQTVNKLNTLYDLDIPVKEQNQSVPRLTHVKTDVILLHSTKKDMYFIFSYNKKYAHMFRNYLKRYRAKCDEIVWTTTDNPKYAVLPKCRKRIWGWFITKEEYEKELPKGIKSCVG